MSDATSLFIEYLYDNFQLVGWMRDNQGNYITETLLFPDDLLPVFHVDVEDELYRITRDEYIIEVETEKFYNWLHSYFCGWFKACWNQVSKKQQIIHTVTTYFSVHDTYWYENLETGKEENLEEIASKFGWSSF